MVVLAILRLDDRAYGVTIRREICECRTEKPTPGALFTTLDRLEEKGVVSPGSAIPLLSVEAVRSGFSP